jgi:hypothetical protein
MKFSFYSLMILTGFMTFILSAFFFLGTRENYQELLNDFAFSFFIRWIVGAIIGIIFFLGIGSIIWFLGWFLGKHFEGKIKVLVLGLAIQILGSFLGCLHFFSK